MNIPGNYIKGSFVSIFTIYDGIWSLMVRELDPAISARSYVPAVSRDGLSYSRGHLYRTLNGPGAIVEHAVHVEKNQPGLLPRPG